MCPTSRRLFFGIIISFIAYNSSAQWTEDLWIKKDSIARAQLMVNKPKGLALAKSNYLQLIEGANKSTKATLTATLSYAYDVNGDFIRALEYRLKAIQLYEQLGDNKALIENYNMLGGIFYNIGSYDKTASYTNLAIKNALKNHREYLPTLYNNLAGAYRSLSLYDSALYYTRVALPFAKQEASSSRLMYGYSTLAEIYLDMNACDSALQIINKALALGAETDMYAQTFLNCDLAQVYWCLNDTARATNKATYAYNLAVRHVYPVVAFESSKLLTTLWEAVGNTDSSFHYKQIMVSMQDSIWSREKENQLNQVIINHRENEILKQKEATEKQKALTTYSIIIGIIILFSLIVFIFSDRKRKKLNKKLQRQKVELEQLNNFRDKIFSIVIHDFKTPINSIENMLELIINGHLSGKESENLAEKMKKYVDRSKTSIDNLITWLKSQSKSLEVNNQVIQLDDFLTDIKTYHLGIAEQKNIDLEIASEQPLAISSDQGMLTIILNNLISNAIKYSPKGSKVIIEASKAIESLKFKIIDNGQGFDAADNIKSNIDYTIETTKRNGSGLGLLICRELVNKLKGTMDIKSAPGKGTTVELIFSNVIVN